MCFLAFNQMHIRILDAFHDFSYFLFLYTCQNHENYFAPSIHQIYFRNSRCCIYINRNASNASRCISNAWFWSLLTTSYFNLLLTGSLLYIYIYTHSKGHKFINVMKGMFLDDTMSNLISASN